jgi:RNA polymerase sigma-70 factor (ECF subfamily)
VTSLAAIPSDSPDEIVIRSAEAREAISTLRRLRPLDREILMLSAWEGLSASEIAATLGVSVDAAKKRLERAKRRFAGRLHPTSSAFGAAGTAFDKGTNQ